MKYLVPWKSEDGSEYTGKTEYWPIKCSGCNKLLGYGGACCPEENLEVVYATCLDCFKITKKKRVADD
jgi:hypothetical protein